MYEEKVRAANTSIRMETMRKWLLFCDTYKLVAYTKGKNITT